MTATAANAEWTQSGESDELIAYVDRATIRRNGNLVKMWDLVDYKTVQKVDGESYLTQKSQREYDCKEEKIRLLAYLGFDGKLGSGKAFYSASDPIKWAPISPESAGELLWKIACGKK